MIMNRQDAKYAKKEGKKINLLVELPIKSKRNIPNFQLLTKNSTTHLC
jgi:hypothetical protein